MYLGGKSINFGLGEEDKILILCKLYTTVGIYVLKNCLKWYLDMRENSKKGFTFPMKKKQGRFCPLNDKICIDILINWHLK